MASVKAKLRVVLHADETVVAEVEDAILWQKVLLAINEPAKGFAPLENPAGNGGATGGEKTPANLNNLDDPVDKFAARLGISREEVEGACAPSTEAPFMHLDVHSWEAMKSQLPARGTSAMAPIALAVTLLALWFREAGLGNPTQSAAQAVLRTINVEDKNASRGISRASWLQNRGNGVVVLNPAQVSKAISIAKMFCLKQWRAEPG